MTAHGKLRVVVSQWNLKLKIILHCAHVVFVALIVCEVVAFTDKWERKGTFQLHHKSNWSFFKSSWFPRSCSYLSTLRPRRSHADSWVEFSHTFQWQGRVWRGEECVWKSTAWSHQADCRGNERGSPLTHAPPRTHLYLLPPHIPSSAPSAPSARLIQPGAGIALIIQKVTCGLLLSPRPSFTPFPSHLSKKKMKRGEGDSQRESQSWSFLSSP